MKHVYIAFYDEIIFRTLFGQTDRQTDRETDRQTDRPTDRQTDRQTDRVYREVTLEGEGGGGLRP